MPLASHVELPARYRVARHIASGGMASVWETEDLLLGRTVAVKVLAAHYAADPAARARFEREARTAARVSDHQHVATIYDTGEHAGHVFIVMEYFAGGTVADRVRAARESGTPIARDTALRWLGEAAAGLDVAHAAGIVHRDVKPANLLLDERDRLAVADFGIARLADDTQMTKTGMVLGTAAYLSPEQAVGRRATAASDRYALAVVAYELLTGERPFDEGPPVLQMRQHAEAPPPRATRVVADLPAAVDAALARGMAKEPAQRPATATAFVEELDEAVTRPTEAIEPPPEPVDRPRALPPLPPRRPAPPVPPPPPAPRGGPGRPPPASGPGRTLARSRGRALVPVALIALVALLVGGLVALAVNSADPRSEPTADTPAGERTQQQRQTATSERQQQQQQQPQAPAQDTAPAPAPASAATADSPAELNQRGFALSNAGRYGEALVPLQAAVEAYREAGDTSSLDYAYALFNYGVALNRSGNPSAAIDVLTERLEIKDQRGTVMKELRDAERRLGGGGDGAKKPKGGAKQDKADED